jgi:hypothetical protein
VAGDIAELSFPFWMSVASLPREVALTPYQRKREILRCPSGRSSLIGSVLYRAHQFEI